MSNQDHNIRVRVDADEAQREIKQTADALDGMGDATKRAGREGEDATRSVDRQTDSVGNLKGEVKGMVAGWASFGVIASTMTRLLGEIGDAARNASEQVASLGANTRGLAANIGGEAADRTVAAINEIAVQNSLGPDERDELIAGAATLTDLQDLNQQQLQSKLQQLALLRRGTGQGGPEIAGLFTSATTRLGLSDAEAANQLGLLLNSGFEAATIRETIDKGGGQDALALLLGTRSFGDPNKRGEALNQVLSSVSRRDPQGNLVPELQAAGLNAGQSEFERLRVLAEARGAGRISDAQLQAALGGFEQVQSFGPFAEAINTGQLDTARQSLGSFTVQQAIDAQRQSRAVRFAEEQAARELRAQVAGETVDAAEAAGAVDEVRTRLRESGMGNETLGIGGAAARGVVAMRDAPARGALSLLGEIADLLRQSLAEPRTAIGNQFNTGGNPDTDPVNRMPAEYGGLLDPDARRPPEIHYHIGLQVNSGGGPGEITGRTNE